MQRGTVSESSEKERLEQSLCLQPTFFFFKFYKLVDAVPLTVRPQATRLSAGEPGGGFNWAVQSLGVLWFQLASRSILHLKSTLDSTAAPARLPLCRIEQIKEDTRRSRELR